MVFVICRSQNGVGVGVGVRVGVAVGVPVGVGVGVRIGVDVGVGRVTTIAAHDWLLPVSVSFALVTVAQLVTVVLLGGAFT